MPPALGPAAVRLAIVKVVPTHARHRVAPRAPMKDHKAPRARTLVVAPLVLLEPLLVVHAAKLHVPCEYCRGHGCLHFRLEQQSGTAWGGARDVVDTVLLDLGLDVCAVAVLAEHAPAALFGPALLPRRLDHTTPLPGEATVGGGIGELHKGNPTHGRTCG